MNKMRLNESQVKIKFDIINCLKMLLHTINQLIHHFTRSISPIAWHNSSFCLPPTEYSTYSDPEYTRQ